MFGKKKLQFSISHENTSVSLYILIWYEICFSYKRIIKHVTSSPWMSAILYHRTEYSDSNSKNHIFLLNLSETILPVNFKQCGGKNREWNTVNLELKWQNRLRVLATMFSVESFFPFIHVCPILLKKELYLQPAQSSHNAVVLSIHSETICPSNPSSAILSMLCMFSFKVASLIF